MKLYEINSEIEAILSLLEPDPETGEVLNDDDTVWEKLQQLQVERKRILEYLAKTVLDTRASAAMLKAEEQRLKKRRAAFELKEARLMAILDRECAGQKTDCGVATVGYRKTSRVEISDNDSAVKWLDENGYSGFYKIPEPEISKSEIKKILAAGTEIPGVQLVQALSCSLR